VPSLEALPLKDIGVISPTQLREEIDDELRGLKDSEGVSDLFDVIDSKKLSLLIDLIHQVALKQLIIYLLLLRISQMQVIIL
jgi:hypothetical protein